MNMYFDDPWSEEQEPTRVTEHRSLVSQLRRKSIKTGYRLAIDLQNSQPIASCAQLELFRINDCSFAAMKTWATGKKGSKPKVFVNQAVQLRLVRNGKNWAIAAHSDHRWVNVCSPVVARRQKAVHSQEEDGTVLSPINTGFLDMRLVNLQHQITNNEYIDPDTGTWRKTIVIQVPSSQKILVPQFHDTVVRAGSFLPDAEKNKVVIKVDRQVDDILVGVFDKDGNPVTELSYLHGIDLNSNDIELLELAVRWVSAETAHGQPLLVISQLDSLMNDKIQASRIIWDNDTILAASWKYISTALSWNEYNAGLCHTVVSAEEPPDALIAVPKSLRIDSRYAEVSFNPQLIKKGMIDHFLWEGIPVVGLPSGDNHFMDLLQYRKAVEHKKVDPNRQTRLTDEEVLKFALAFEDRYKQQKDHLALFADLVNSHTL
jgi:hypothetical protein